MVNLDLLESYKATSMSKDIRFVNNLQLPTGNKSISKLVDYVAIKKRVEDFSQDEEIKKYDSNPLIEIRAEIERKETELNKEFEVEVSKLRDNVYSYLGDNVRKYFEVENELNNLSTINTFLNTNYDFDSAKDQIRKTIYDKVHSKKKNKMDRKLKDRIKTAIYGGILVGGMFIGSVLFPKPETVYTTIDSKIYSDPNVPVENKLDQIRNDKYILSKYETQVFKETTNEIRALINRKNK